MTDEQLDKLLNDARATYRVPPEPPLDEMWAAIDAKLERVEPRGGLGAPRRGTTWRVVGLAAAAALVLGVGVGRWSAPATERDSSQLALDSTSGNRTSVRVSPTFQHATSTYPGETEALLSDVQARPGGSYSVQAAALLVKTRLLLDSPAATDQRMRDLLEDLELVLAQVANLPAPDGGARHTADLNTIRNAMAERDVVPRLRTAVVTLASLDDE